MPVDLTKIKLVSPLLGDGQELLYEYPGATDGAGTVILVRPMIGEEAEQFFALTGNVLDKGAREFPARCKGWNVADPKNPGHAAAVTEANYRRLPHPVQKWIVECLTGYGLARVETPDGVTTEQGRAEKNSPGPSASMS